jgi:two-component sensor histidine kinase
MSAISDWLFGAADGTPLEGDMLRRPDILQESWHGVSLAELVRSRLSSHLDRTRPQVLIVGDGVLLKPDVAQSLGLALHELASNAEKFGALSVPDGRLWIAWRRVAQSDGGGWSCCGPRAAVRASARRHGAVSALW